MLISLNLKCDRAMLIFVKDGEYTKHKKTQMIEKEIKYKQLMRKTLLKISTSEKNDQLSPSPPRSPQ